MEKTVAFYTLGCKVNQYETNAIAQKFIEKGCLLIWHPFLDHSFGFVICCTVHPATVLPVPHRTGNYSCRSV